MERLITFTSISAVTICSMLLALLIEAALLKAIFHFMSHISAESVADVAPAPRPRNGRPAPELSTRS